MTRKLVLAIALSALTVTACGSKNGYKAAQFNKASYPLAEELNLRASRDIEVNALKLIMADELFVSSKDNVLSNALKQEILGVSAKVTLGDKAVIEVSKLDDKAVDCKETTTKVEIDKSSIKSLNRINNFGRVACVDDNCENIVVLMETRRHVKTEENTNGSIIDGSVAILLKKEASGLHKPLTTESTEFLQINAADVATATCLELVAEQEAEKQMEKVQQEADKNPSSDQAVRNQKQHTAQMEKVQKEIGKNPSSDEALRNQNQRLAQNARLKAIDDRIKAIDARQIELSKSSTKTDEPKALATERSQLIKERDGILAPRNLPKVDTVEPQPEAVDPI